MWSKLRLGTLIFSGLLLIGAAGCSPAASAISKLQSGDIGSISATEWQALAGLGAQFGFQIPSLSDEQAQAVVDFLDSNGIESVADLEAAIQGGTLVVPDNLIELFGNFL